MYEVLRAGAMRKEQTMISAIGSTGIARHVQLQGEGVTARAPVAKTGSATSEAAAPASPAALMAAEGAPIDTDKVAAIRAKIAAGTYAIDPKAIADKMIAADLPAKA